MWFDAKREDEVRAAWAVVGGEQEVAGNEQIGEAKGKSGFEDGERFEVPV